MRSNRLAAGVVAIVLGISGVALASAELGADIGPTAKAEATAAGGGVAVDVTAAARTRTSAPDTSVPNDDRTPTTGPSTTTTAPGTTTSTSLDDRSHDDDHGDRRVVALDVRTHAAADAATVTVAGMTLVAVDVNPGWSFEVDEASARRIRISFERDGQEVEFELRADGELRVKLGG